MSLRMQRGLPKCRQESSSSGCGNRTTIGIWAKLWLLLPLELHLPRLRSSTLARWAATNVATTGMQNTVCLVRKHNTVGNIVAAATPPHQTPSQPTPQPSKICAKVRVYLRVYLPEDLQAGLDSPLGDTAAHEDTACHRHADICRPHSGHSSAPLGVSPNLRDSLKVGTGAGSRTIRVSPCSPTTPPHTLSGLADLHTLKQHNLISTYTATMVEYFHRASRGRSPREKDLGKVPPCRACGAALDNAPHSPGEVCWPPPCSVLCRQWGVQPNIYGLVP